MGVLRELKKHNVHWFIVIAAALYLIAFMTGVRPLHFDQVPHAEVVHTEAGHDQIVN